MIDHEELLKLVEKVEELEYENTLCKDALVKEYHEKDKLRKLVKKYEDTLSEIKNSINFEVRV